MLIPTKVRIVEAADDLFYRQGFERTTFADISSAVNISRGNFYYHFKTKDEILNSVISYRIEKTESLLQKWDKCDDNPRDRIVKFINILVVNRDKIRNYGCPVGTLTMELSKLSHPAQTDANRLVLLFKNWLKSNFRKLGIKNEAEFYALHLLARSQGVATISNALKSKKFVMNEIKDMTDWLDSVLAV